MYIYIYVCVHTRIHYKQKFFIHIALGYTSRRLAAPTPIIWVLIYFSFYWPDHVSIDLSIAANDHPLIQHVTASLSNYVLMGFSIM